MHACNIYDLAEYELLICMQTCTNTHTHTHTVYNQTTFCTKLSNFIHINSFYQLNCTRLKFIHISFFLLFNNKPSINKDLNKTNVEQKPTVFEKLCWLLMQVSNWTLISCQPHRTVELCRKQTQMSKLLYKPILKSVHNIVQELCESRWTSWAVHPNEPSGFCGRKDLLNRASALVTTCP